VLCDKSLLASFAGNTHAVTPRQVRAAIADSDFAPVPGSKWRSSRPLAAAALLAAGALGGVSVFYWLDQGKSAPAASAPAVPSPLPPASSPAPAAAPANAPTPAAEQAPVPEAAAPEKPAAPLLAPEQRRRLEGYSPGRNPLLRERIATAREKLESEPDTSYSIELFIAENSDAARAERFLMRARELVPLADVYVIPVATGSRYFLRVAYSAYPSKEAAAEAAKHLPPKYQNAFRFELRSFAELRAAI
jgi:septal ring-binding cell division protein DamX